MLTRHSAAAMLAFCAIIPALVQDSIGSTDSWPPAVRATAAYPVRQDASQWLGSNLIGARVVSASNQTIGKVSNLVINEDGAIEAAVIAIGGVLGLGRKDVAVTYKSLNIVRTQAGDAIDHVTLAAEKGELRRVAEFKTLRQQRSDTARRRDAAAPTAVSFQTSE
jgi:sporulation protein YlmC with PRC-barrel domain